MLRSTELDIFIIWTENLRERRKAINWSLEAGLGNGVGHDLPRFLYDMLAVIVNGLLSMLSLLGLLDLLGLLGLLWLGLLAHSLA